jgi:hypothetical protein
MVVSLKKEVKRAKHVDRMETLRTAEALARQRKR